MKQISNCNPLYFCFCQFLMASYTKIMTSYTISFCICKGFNKNIESTYAQSVGEKGESFINESKKINCRYVVVA